MSPFFRFLITAFLLGSLSAFADSGASKKARVLPAGIAFPATYHAASVNAASLAGHGKGNLLEGGYGPNAQDGDPQRFEGGFATVGKNLGLGVEYTGTKYGTNPLTNGGAIGAGASFSPLGVGLGLRDADLANGVSPVVDLALDFEPEAAGKGVHVGGVLYGINQTPYVGAYLGFIKEGNYFLEADVVTPTLSSLSGAYRIGVAAGVMVNRFGFSFHSRYDTGWKGFDHTIGGTIWVLDWWNVGVQFDTPRHFLFRTAFTF